MAPPRKGRGPLPDSVAAHPKASRTLTNLFSSGTVQKGDSAKKWRLHEDYFDLFASIDPEKFRKRFTKLYKDKFAASETHTCLGTRNTTSKDDDGFIVNDSDVEQGIVDFSSAPAGTRTNSELPTFDHKPLYILAKWKDPRTRDGRLALVVLLPSGILDTEGGVKAEIDGGCAVNLIFKWPRVMLDHMKLTSTLLAFCSDMTVAHGTLLGQGLMDFIEQFQSKEGDEIESTCRIELPFAVKPDFQEDVITFQNSSVVLYLLRFAAFERNFAAKSSKLRIHTVEEVPN